MNQVHNPINGNDDGVMSPALIQDHQDVAQDCGHTTAFAADKESSSSAVNVTLQKGLFIRTNGNQSPPNGKHNGKHGITAHTDETLLKPASSPVSMVSLSKLTSQAVNASHTAAPISVTDLVSRGISLLPSLKNGDSSVKTLNGARGPPRSLLGIQTPSAMTPNINPMQGSDETSDVTSCQSASTINQKKMESVASSIALPTTESKMLPPAAPIVQTLPEVVKRQHSIEKRVTRLMKRLRRVQAIESSRHVTQQIALVVEKQHRTLEDVAENSMKKPLTGLDETPATFKQTEEIKNMSTTALVSLVQRLQTTQSSLRQRMKHGEIDAKPLLTVSSEDRQEAFKATSVMTAGLRHIQHDVDSEATESSSGGETDEEDTTLTSQKNAFPATRSIKTRACWRWNKERSATIARWTWLQAQVSDLEYRIRQHGELHRQLRATKQQLSSTHDPVAMTEEATQRAARCQAPPSEFRKHRLIHLSQAPSLGQKARRDVIVRCDCVKSLRQCALCAGHHNYASPSRMYLHSSNERVAQLDYSYHPVLSYGRDVKPGTLLEDQVNTADTMKHTAVISESSIKTKKEKEKKSKYKKKLEKQEKQKHDGHKKKYKKRSSVDMDLDEYDPRLDSENSSKKKGKKKLTGKRPRTNSLPQLDEYEYDSDVDSPLTQSAPTPDLKDTKTPLSAYAIQKQRRENAYDIDNIVIPYSMAAATRVERLQYKEIDTPKWRELDSNGDILKELTPDMEAANLVDDLVPVVEHVSLNDQIDTADIEPSCLDSDPPVKLTEPDSVQRTASMESNCSALSNKDSEDISDEVFLARHSRCEQNEKKRYFNFITSATARRNRAPSNAASLRNGELSGTATPDPWSPDSSFCGDMKSPVVNLARESQEAIEEELESHRKRSASFTAGRIKRDVSHDDDTPQVAPWVPRPFPLSEQDEESLDPGWLPPPRGPPVKTEWTVINTEEDEESERVAIVLKLAKQH